MLTNCPTFPSVRGMMRRQLARQRERPARCRLHVSDYERKRLNSLCASVFFVLGTPSSCEAVLRQPAEGGIDRLTDEHCSLLPCQQNHKTYHKELVKKPSLAERRNTKSKSPEVHLHVWEESPGRRPSRRTTQDQHTGES